MCGPHCSLPPCLSADCMEKMTLTAQWAIDTDFSSCIGLFCFSAPPCSPEHSHEWQHAWHPRRWLPVFPASQGNWAYGHLPSIPLFPTSGPLQHSAQSRQKHGAYCQPQGMCCQEARAKTGMGRQVVRFPCFSCLAHMMILSYTEGFSCAECFEGCFVRKAAWVEPSCEAGPLKFLQVGQGKAIFTSELVHALDCSFWPPLSFF